MPSFALDRTSSSNTRSVSKSLQILRETTVEVYNKCRREFGSDSEEAYQHITSIDVFLDWIAGERLRRMPHRGGKWDRILHNAAYFASQIELFQETVGDFVSHSHVAARLIWSTCLILLKLGPAYSNTLDKVFSTLSDIGSNIAFLHQNAWLFASTVEIQQSLAYIYSDICKLVINVAAQYGQQQKDVSVGGGAFFTLFGATIESIYTRKHQICNYMWAYAIKQDIGVHSYGVHIETIRSFLEPSDRIVRLISSNRASSRSTRADFSCTWFMPQITDFARSQDKVLLVSGKAGCGKSVLSGWISERLPRLEGQNAHDVISFAITNDVRSQLTSAAVAKGLLLQLLDRKIGDCALYEALVTIHNKSSGAVAPEKAEDALWNAIKIGLQGVSNTMIVVDGVEKLSGGEVESVKLLDRLHGAVAGSQFAKVIALSQPLGKATSQKTRSFVIDHNCIQADIGYMVHDALHTQSQFRGLKHAEIDRIIQRISSSADGSFVWAVLSLELLKREKTVSGIVATVDTLPKTIAESLKKLTALVNLKDHDTRSVLAWLLVAERPLTVAEMKIFFEIDLGATARKPRYTDIERDIMDAVGPIVYIQDGIVRLKHDLIRQHFVSLAASVKDLSNTGDFPFMIKEAHYDLCTRILAYVKLFVTRHVELTTKPISHTVLYDLFDSYTVLQYASTYWVSHFKQSPMYEPTGKHRLVPEFRNCFPNSLILVQIESTLWETYQSSNYELALYIRQTLLGKQNLVVLQNIIVIARIMELISHHEKASTYYYQAYELAQTLFTEENEMLIHLAAAYLTVSTVKTITEWDEVAIKRETLIKRIITYYKKTYGISHDVTYKYMKMLAVLYTETKQVELAVTTWEEVYRISIERTGRTSTETTTVYQSFIDVCMKSSRKDTIIEELKWREYEDITRSCAITEERRWKSTMEMVSFYESRKQFTKAEEILVGFWQEISRVSSTTKDVAVQKRKIETTNYYCEYLKRSQRSEEAKTVIEGLWSEYSNTEIHSETLAVSVKSIATQMRSLSLFKQAKSVLSSVFSYYKKTNKTTSSEAKEVSTELSETTREMIEQSYLTSTSTSTTTTSTTGSSSTSSSSSSNEESSLVEILDTFSSSSSSSTTISKSTLTTVLKTSQKLTSTYVRQGRWMECVQACSQSLSLTWASFLSLSSAPCLPGEFHEEVVELALRMAEANFALRHIEMAEELYLYIFRSCKTSCKFTDKLVLRTARELLHFYQTTYQFHKAFTVYTEYYMECKTHYGAAHARTIDIAYEIGHFCEKENRIQRAEQFYLDIYTALVKGNECPDEAVKAARCLLIIYDNDARWDSCEKIVHTLWHTFCHKGTATVFETEFVEKLYNIYIYILKDVRKVSKEEIYKVTSQYREACVKVYGARNVLSIKSTIQLAQLCETVESRQEESISLYEEATKQVSSVARSSSSSTSTSSSSATTTTMTSSSFTSIMSSVSQAKRNLARLYSSKETSSTSVEKATSLYSEEVQSSVSEYGYTDVRSLERIEEMCEFQAKHKKTEQIQKSLTILKTAIQETITKVTETQQLIKSASVIARSYMKCEQTETAREVLREIRRQVITGNYSETNKFGINLKGSSTSVRSFVVSFEQTLKGTHTESHFSELMSELMTESLLYQSYTLCVKESTSFEKIFSQGSRLAQFYEKRGRREEYTRIYNEMFELFAKHLKANKENKTLRFFYDVCVGEMTSTRSETTIVVTATNTVFEYMQKKYFQEAYDLAWYIDRFVHLHGGWRDHQSVETGFLLCLYLTGRANANKCGDAKLHKQMVELSRDILSEVLRAAREINIQFIQMEMKRINEITALLSEQKNYNDLEWLLSELWQSRNSQTTWDSVTIVWIGRRLVEVRYAIGRKSESIHLAEDISYNLRRVWGATDKTTCEMFSLLSELYTACGEYAKALHLQEDMLRQITSACAEGDLSDEEGAQLAQRHLYQLKYAYIRNGGWTSTPAENKEKAAANFRDLYSSLNHHFSSHKSFTSVPALDKWSTSEKIENATAGTYVMPSSFDIFSVGEKVHKNNLRRISGLIAGQKQIIASAMNGHTHHHHHHTQQQRQQRNGNGVSTASPVAA